MRDINKIVRDERAYIESIGKQDKETVREALADKGESTVLRLCIGASDRQLPLRSLGYAVSAMAVQQYYFPEAQLQLVYPLKAAEAANGLAVEDSIPHAEEFNTHASGMADGNASLVPLMDGYTACKGFAGAVAEVLDTCADLSRLSGSADRRKGDFALYVASHILVHDTDKALIEMPRDFYMETEEPPIKARRIISIGAQSERPFYNARMACRAAGVMPEGSDIPTGQLFTRHVIPPYQYCRQGEPSLGALGDGDFSKIKDSHPVPSVQRDLEFMAASEAAQDLLAARQPAMLELGRMPYFGED